MNPKVSFVLKFAFKDLFPSLSESTPAILTILVVCLMVIAGIVMSGLKMAIDRTIRKELGDPCTLHLKAGIGLGSEMKVISPRTVHELGSLCYYKGEIVPNSEYPYQITNGSCGWNYAALWFYKANGELVPC